MTGSSPIPASTPAGTDDRWLRTPSVVAPFVVGAVVLALATLPLDRGVVAAFAAGVLVVLSAIDLERGIIPNRIVLPAAALALTMQVALFPDRAAEWAFAGALAAAVFAVPHLFRRDWIGMGDVKLVLLIGVVLGWGVVSAVFIAFLCVFPVAVLMLVRHGVAARKATIPLGPFLSLGALIVLLLPV